MNAGKRGYLSFPRPSALVRVLLLWDQFQNLGRLLAEPIGYPQTQGYQTGQDKDQ